MGGRTTIKPKHPKAVKAAWKGHDDALRWLLLDPDGPKLTAQLGEAYEESVVRGYEFHQLPPKAQGRKRKGRRERSSAVENASPNERQ